MSAQALQRVIVRMLYDPSFVNAVFKAPELALQGVDITETEKSWLLASERRAYATDPERRSRSLQALLEEYPVSTALTGKVRQQEAFFSSVQFHTAIQERGSMAGAFAEYLKPVVGPMASLEGAMAKVRRIRPRQSCPFGLWLRLAQLEIITTPEGLLERYQAAFSLLRKQNLSLLESLLRSKIQPGRLPAIGAASVYVMVFQKNGEKGMQLEEIPDGLAAILEFAAEPHTWQDLLAVAHEHGAESPTEAQEILEGLVKDGLLSGA